MKKDVRTKKVFLLITLLMLVIGITGCGKSSSEETGNNKSETTNKNIQTEDDDFNASIIEKKRDQLQSLIKTFDYSDADAKKIIDACDDTDIEELSAIMQAEGADAFKKAIDGIYNKINGTENNSAETDVSEENTEETEADKEIPFFDAVPEWGSLTADDRAVQIDDKLYKPGMLVSEAINNLESSEMNYKFEYDPELLMSVDKRSEIEVFYPGIQEPWFVLGIENTKEDPVKTCDAYLTRIVVNTAKDHARYLDGRSYGDILSMTSDEVEAFGDSYFVDHDKKILSNIGSSITLYGETIQTDAGINMIEYNYLLTFAEGNIKDWENKSESYHYMFYIDAYTKNVIGFVQERHH